MSPLMGTVSQKGRVMRITCWITFWCLMIAVTGCGLATSRGGGNAPSTQAAKPWSRAHGVAFRPPVPTRPATQAAPTTQRPRRTLAGIVQEVSPTAEQHAAAVRTLEAAQRDWVA